MFYGLEFTEVVTGFNNDYRVSGSRIYHENIKLVTKHEQKLLCIDSEK